MSRRRRPRSSSRDDRDRPAPRPVFGGHEQVEEWPDGTWVVRRVTGAASTKTYRCPGCQQLIRPATPHVVAWPAEPGILGGPAADERRHWHAACWRARDRRRP